MCKFNTLSTIEMLFKFKLRILKICSIVSLKIPSSSIGKNWITNYVVFVLVSSVVRCRLLHFRLFLWNYWMYFHKTWQEARYQRPLSKLCFRVYQKTELRIMWYSSLCRPSSGVDFYIFDFSSETTERISTKLDRKQDINVPYQNCVFGSIRKLTSSPWPLNRGDIFDFSNVTTKRNSRNLDKSL